MITTRNLCWLAGILEGEGCFTVNHASRNPYIKVIVGMTDRDVVEDCKKLTNIGTISGPHSDIGGNKAKWVWSVNKQVDAAALMMTVYPLMRSRRQERIRECLEVWRGVSSRYTVVDKYKEIRRLYRRTSLTQLDIAKKFNITRDHVNAIVNNRHGKFYDDRPAERK